MPGDVKGSVERIDARARELVGLGGVIQACSSNCDAQHLATRLGEMARLLEEALQGWRDSEKGRRIHMRLASRALAQAHLFEDQVSETLKGMEEVDLFAWELAVLRRYTQEREVIGKEEARRRARDLMLVFKEGE